MLSHTHFYSHIILYIYIYTCVYIGIYDKSATLPRALLALGMSQICFFFQSESLIGGNCPPTTHHPRPHHHRISSKAKITKEALGSALRADDACWIILGR